MPYLIVLLVALACAFALAVQANVQWLIENRYKTADVALARFPAFRTTIVVLGLVGLVAFGVSLRALLLTALAIFVVVPLLTLVLEHIPGDPVGRTAEWLARSAPTRPPSPTVATPSETETEIANAAPWLSKRKALEPESANPAPWPSARADARNTGCARVAGPTRARLLWQWHAGTAWIRGAPVIAADGGIVLAADKGLVALTTQGMEHWRIAEASYTLPAIDERGRIISATSAELLLISPDGSDVRRIPHALRGLPAINTRADRIYVVAEQSVVEFDLEGQQLWSGTCLRQADFPPALSSDGAVFVASYESIAWNPDDASESYDEFAMLRRPDKPDERRSATDSGMVAPLWHPTAAACFPDGRPVCGVGGDLIVGESTWPLRGGGPLVLLPDGWIVACTETHVVCVGDRAVARWRAQPTGHQPVGDVEGRIYYMGADSVVRALDGERGRELWSWEMPNEGNRREWAVGLAVGSDLLLVATRSRLFALGE